MVNSRFEYVKQFEAEQKLLKDTFICVDVNATDFDQFCIDHNFSSPYDDRIIRLSAACARQVMENFVDVDICYGYQCDFSFIFKRSSSIFNRRRDKILTNLSSLFASTFTFQWSKYFPMELIYPPNFVSTITLFPRLRIVKDYLLWRQTLSAQSCLYNYASHILIRSGVSKDDAFQQVKDLTVQELNEVMFKHGINFSFLPDWHKRGKTLFREKKIIETSDDFASKKPEFWKKHAKLLKD